MTNHTLHLVFGSTAAATLKQVLRDAGRSDEVLWLDDDLSFGPIANDNTESRQRWVEKELGCTWRDDITNDSTAFLERSLAHTGSITAWTSWNTALDHAGFLWWLSHTGDRPTGFVQASALGSLNETQIQALLDTAIPLSIELRSACQARWRKLKDENADLRVIESGELVSADITYFDDLLLSHATRNWRKMALIVGYTFGDFMDAEVYQTGDLVLAARLAALAEAGRLEWRGDLSSMRKCELRLPESN